jgi:hypothetical protein
MFPFAKGSSLIVACAFTGVYDVNRSETLQNDDEKIFINWLQSVVALNLHGIIFHNNFTPAFCKKFQNKNIVFIQKNLEVQFNPNVYRYVIYDNFLTNYFDEISNIFFTDISDVVVLNNPFLQPLFLNHSNKIFCGDEPTILNNEWMNAHSAHLRSKITDYNTYEEKYKNETLLNCGIMGGNIAVMKTFINQLANLHLKHNFDNKTNYTGDMGAFNYLVRNKYNTTLQHGVPVNTIFKAYETQRTDCWFRHK